MSQLICHRNSLISGAIYAKLVRIVVNIIHCIIIILKLA